MTTNVVKFPQPSEADKQFLELEKQREAIKQQTKLIKKMEKDKNDS